MSDMNFVDDYIIEALFCLMEKKPYAEISMTDIANKAGIGRTTIYRHFKTKDEMIFAFLSKETEDFVRRDHFIPQHPLDYLELFEVVFLNAKRKKEQLKILLKQNLEHFYYTFVNEGFKMHFKAFYHEWSHYTAFGYAGALSNMTIAWLRNDCKESPKELAKTLYAIIFPTQSSK